MTGRAGLYSGVWVAGGGRIGGAPGKKRAVTEGVVPSGQPCKRKGIMKKIRKKANFKRRGLSLAPVPGRSL
jgi:hypothetical protein